MAELTVGTRVMIGIISTAFLVMNSVDSQDSVLTWVVYAYPTMSMHQFSVDKFTEFYACLCTYAFDTCEVRLDYSWAVSVSAETMLTDSVSGSDEFSSRYLCKRRLPDYYLLCERLRYKDDGCKSNYTKGCWRISLNNQTAVNCDTSFVEIIWDPALEIKAFSYDDTIIHSALCEGGCNFGAALTPTTASISRDVVAQDQDNDDDNIIIIGVVVGTVVLAVLLTVMGVVLWRRRRNAASRTTSNRNNTGVGTSDTPSYVAFPDVKNAQPSQISDAPSTTNEMSLYTNATADPTEKTRSKGAVHINSTEDPGYYNQFQVASNTHPQFDYPSKESNIAVKQEP